MTPCPHSGKLLRRRDHYHHALTPDTETRNQPMTSLLEFLQVHGDKVFNESGQEVRLRGFCLGSWLNLESFMVGFPGTETEFRRAVAKVLGAEKGDYFFERFQHYFASQADFDYINSLGCNLMRVAFNYHHFEDDQKPFEYKPEGFEWLDKVIAWANSAGVYLSLDFHAFPGWQSRGWHCDNPAGGLPQFWEQVHFQDRAVALWEALARRYKDEPAVAMYGIMNEPEAREAAQINGYYQRVTAAIRAIDRRHILNFEGNLYSQDFSQLDPPPDRNVIYSSHLYVNAGLDDVEYPGIVNGEYFDRAALEKIYQQRRSYCVQHNIPHYISEFGPVYNDPAFVESKLQVISDYLDIIESYGDHWTIWNYKDLGKMGIVTVLPDSDWMQRIRPVHVIKTDLRADSWIDRSALEFDSHLNGFATLIQSRLDLLPGNWRVSPEELAFLIGDRFLSGVLLPAFAEQFRDMNEAEIDTMLTSFAFENCYKRTTLETIIKKYTRKE
jgi:endoglucanase